MASENNLNEHGLSMIRAAPYCLAVCLSGALILSFFFEPTITAAVVGVCTGFILTVIWYFHWSNNSLVLFSGLVFGIDYKGVYGLSIT
jgi:hypothetical protein